MWCIGAEPLRDEAREDIHTRTFLETSPSRPRLSQNLSNTTHSELGYYALVAQTTLNPCAFLCLSVLSGKP
jgi:hypothetical protein